MRRTVSHRRAVALVLLGLILATATVATTAFLRRPDTPVAAVARASDVLAQLPLSFAPTGDGFVSRGPGYSLALTATEATIDVGGGTFRLRPTGPLADPHATVTGDRPLGGTVNHLIGDDPRGWRTGLPTFGRVEIRQVWPGIDMVWHGDQHRLEHDMVVAPGIDPSVVALDVEGARALRLEPGGDLVLDLGATSARLARPVAYQEVGGHRRGVSAAFRLLGPSGVGFSVGAYDPALPLIIDPTLITSTFLGGTGNDSAYAVAVDAQGNTYVTGSTESADFPTNAPLQPALNNAAGGPTSDVFVSKLSPDGSRLEWSTYIGGSGRDLGYSLAVASDGSVYVGGVTDSANFPLVRAAQTAYGGGQSDAFFARIAANGSGFEWSTFVGGSQTDRGRGVAVDSAGNGYLTGSTSSTNFPAVNPQQPGPFRDGDLDAFLVKVPFNGTPITYATRLGGGNDDRGLAVAVDVQNNAYVTGDTLSSGFPTVRPLQATSGGSAGGAAGSFADAFLAKYNPTGSALVYSTFLGGSDVDQGTAVAVDSQGAAYVTGNTNSSNFPTVGPLQVTKGNDLDAFVSKVDPAGTALVYSTFYGGSGPDGANAIAVDRTGSAHVVGTTGSANLATAKPLQGTKGPGDDAFVLRLDSTGRGPLFASFLGGREGDSAIGVALGPRGVMHVVGQTNSADFSSVKPVQGARPPAGIDAFVATVDPVDATAPTPPVAAAPTASPSSTSGHDRRVRILTVLTFGLLLAAGLQTMYLRRRAPVTTNTRTKVKPAPLPSASLGLKVLDQAGAGSKAATATKAATASKAATATKAAASKPTRRPKTRGGPKGAAAKKAGAQNGRGGQKGGNRRPPGRPLPETAAVPIAAAEPPTIDREIEPATADLVAEPATNGNVAERVAVEPVAADVDPVAVDVEPVAADVDDGGRPAMAGPAAPPPKVKPQEPAIAQLLEEDLWVGEPPLPSDEPLPSDATPAPDQPESAPEWAPFDTGSTPAVGSTAPSEPAPAIPPVPAEELSFWDLFPEDLPPARATPFPAEDLLASDYLALPEGPDSSIGRLVGPEGGEAGVARVPDPDPLEAIDRQFQRPPHPLGSEIVIAELLEGPPPSGGRQVADSMWAPRSDDPRPEDDPQPDERPQPQDEDQDHSAARSGPGRGDQARIAAEQARRRRSRRGGRGKSPGSGG